MFTYAICFSIVCFHSFIPKRERTLRSCSFNPTKLWYVLVSKISYTYTRAHAYTHMNLIWIQVILPLKSPNQRSKHATKHTAKNEAGAATPLTGWALHRLQLQHGPFTSTPRKPPCPRCLRPNPPRARGHNGSTVRISPCARKAQASTERAERVLNRSELPSDSSHVRALPLKGLCAHTSLTLLWIIW